MVTAHWTGGAFDLSFSNPGIIAPIDVVVPAGATVKRFLTRDTQCDLIRTGVGFEYASGFYSGAVVQIIAGEYSGRVVYQTARALDCDVTALYDNATLQRVYTCVARAADRELAINQKCSYGTAGGPGMTWRFTTGVSNMRGITLPFSGHYVLTFRLLYYTNP